MSASAAEGTVGSPGPGQASRAAVAGGPTRTALVRAAAAARGIPLPTIIATVAVLVLTYLAGKVLYRLRDVILLMFVAGFIALILNPLVVYVQRRIPRRGRSAIGSAACSAASWRRCSPSPVRPPCRSSSGSYGRPPHRAGRSAAGPARAHSRRALSHVPRIPRPTRRSTLAARRADGLRVPSGPRRLAGAPPRRATGWRAGPARR